MRPLLLAALLITSVFALPPASAAAFADDPSGDAQVQIFGGPTAPVALPGSDAADLLALDIEEDAETITFVLKVSSFSQQVSFSRYRIHFEWARDEYVVSGWRQVAEGVFDEDTGAYLYDVEDRDWDPLAELDHALDAQTGTFTIHLPKAYLIDDRGRYPVLGDKLENVYVTAASDVTIFQFGARSFDRMPDGEATKSYSLLYGDLWAGRVRLDADERVRVSNGGATTFVYHVSVSNTGDTDDEVSLIVSELPEGWNATIQSPLRVLGGGERKVPILVSVPFAHDHGGFSSFNLTARSQRDPGSHASIRMGVLHTPIPQPAGHHSELFLHAESFNGGIFGQIFPWAGAYMNTDADHTGDSAEASPWRGGNGFTWRIPLSPMLRMGLDFDIDEVGTLVGSIVGHTRATGTVSAELRLAEMTSDDEDDGILLADSDEVDAALDLNAPTPFKLTITPLEEADYIPYARGQNLVLVLRFRSADDIGTICCLPGNTPGLSTADFKLTLPLNEYHDKLTGLSEAADALELKAEGLVEKTGLPGTTMTYAFTLTNHGSDAQFVNLDLAGTDAGLGTLVPGGGVDLGPKQSRKVTLAVAIPTGKNAGEELEVLLFAHAQSDPSKSAIARTKTIVGKPTQDVAGDESAVLLAAQQAENNQTPGPGALLALAGVGAALALRRRRA